MIFAYILIVFGFVLLGTNLGYLGADAWEKMWQFWPALLILGGISILGKKTIPRYAAVVLSVVVIIITLWLIVSGTTDSIGQKSWLLWGKQKSETNTYLNIDEPLSSDTKSVNLQVNLGAQKMKIDSTASGLISGQVSSHYGEAYMKTNDRNGMVDVTVATRKALRLWPKVSGTDESELFLTNQVPIDMNLKMGATEIDADLTDLKIGNITLNVGAFNGTIKFGNRQESIKSNINAGASDIRIYVPKDSGLKVNYANGLVGMKYSGLDIQRDEKSGKDVSNNYDKATKKVEVDIKAGASSIEFIGE